jgi:predicted permease
MFFPDTPSTRHARSLNRAARLFGLVLLAYPQDFRQELGDQMLEAFRDAWRAAAQRGRGALFRLWLRSVVMGVRAGFSERRTAALAASATPGGGPEQFRYDLMQALRSLNRRPRLFWSAVVVIALATAGISGIFSVYHALLVAPPPGVTAAPLLFRAVQTRGENTAQSFSYPDYEYYRARTRSLRTLVAMSATEAELDSNGARERASIQMVSNDYFEALGVQLRGHGFGNSGVEHLAILSHAYWTTRLGASPEVIGKAIRINGVPFKIVGIAPVGFRGLSVRGAAPELWVPLAAQPVVMRVNWQPFRSRDDRWLNLVGRLREGTTIDAATAELNTLAGQLGNEFPKTNAGVSLQLSQSLKLSESARAEFTALLRLLLVLVFLLQLLACLNLTNLLLTRALQHRRDHAVRCALGAARGRLLRQPLLESLVLATVGGALGLLGAQWIAAVTIRLINLDLTVTFSWLHFGFALVTILMTALLVGAAPALFAFRNDPIGHLRITGAGGSVLHNRSRTALLFGQVVFATILLMVSGAFIQGLRQLSRYEPGFQPNQLYATTIDLRSRNLTRESGVQLYESARARVATIPGIDVVGLVNTVPLSGRERGGGVFIPGRGEEPGAASSTSSTTSSARSPSRRCRLRL